MPLSLASASPNRHERTSRARPLEHARTVFQADVIVGILDEARIPAYRPRGQLVDEFAISQQMMNLQEVRDRMRNCLKLPRGTRCLKSE
jgi:hypothetical protein